MSNLAFVHSILSSPVTLFADAFGFACSASSTTFLTATMWLEMVQYLFRRREECQEQTYPHRFLQHFGFPWRFPIQALTSSGCFAYKNLTRRQLEVEGLLENASFFFYHQAPDSVRNSLCKTSKHHCRWFCGNVNTSTTSHYICPS